jgi:hypothetical protein
LTHSDLVARAGKWLRRQGCRVVLLDDFVCNTSPNEKPDAIGWRDGLSILIECKASRADFLADRKKPFRIDPSQGMGDWRFILAPEGVVQRCGEIPEGWGLLGLTKRGAVETLYGGPHGNCWWQGAPFVDRCHKRNETRMLASALARPTQPRGPDHGTA